jgi:hypothetical protein
MRNLVICCDGTWNTPEQMDQGVPVPTNVVRLFNCVSDRTAQGVQQVRYYHPGVGTDGGWVQRLKEGGIGEGLGRNVQSAYRWLADNWQPGDRIFLFGFSRGAYTVRSLAGMLGACGLLDPKGLDEATIWKRVSAAFLQGYRKRRATGDWGAGWAFHESEAGNRSIPIELVGVWDTVGALGIPDDMALLNLFDDRSQYTFHDTRLGQGIRHARHAIALDERRETFAPTLWDNANDGNRVIQLWFPGVHSDVGGGYPETGLSDGALAWMIDQAGALGLAFRDSMVKQIRPDHLGVLHDSTSGVFAHLRTRPRPIPALDGHADGLLHESAVRRRADPPISQAPYRAGTRLGVGERSTVVVYANEHWNDTGLYLEAGVPLQLRASGEWLDRKIACGPGGTSDGKFQVAELAHLGGALLGKLEGMFKSITRNQQADFLASKRVEKQPWMALIGAVLPAPAADGTPDTSAIELVVIKEGVDWTPARSGYFYAFVNDAWHFYGNNRGSVSLTIARP